MKVQLQGQSLRLRIGEDELARLLDGDVVANETRAPGAILGLTVLVAGVLSAILANDARA